jgi:hypothetical protein
VGQNSPEKPDEEKKRVKRRMEGKEAVYSKRLRRADTPAKTLSACLETY